MQGGSIPIPPSGGSMGRDSVTNSTKMGQGKLNKMAL